MLSLGHILISDLLVANLFVQSLPCDSTLLGYKYLHQRCKYLLLIEMFLQLIQYNPDNYILLHTNIYIYIYIYNIAFSFRPFQKITCFEYLGFYYCFKVAIKNIICKMFFDIKIYKYFTIKVAC